jgi:hypothetical protein
MASISIFLRGLVKTASEVALTHEGSRTGFWQRYGGPAGPLATITRQPGQARKGAATAGTLCAGVWLVGSTSSFQALASFYLNIFSVYLAVFCCAQ